MNKVILKDFWRSIKHTKGQFVSIMGLMMIGAFALVGLMVTGPDMRDTGNHYAQKLKTADLTVICNYGLDHKDTQKIKKTKGLQAVEFGYMTDTVIKNSQESFRIFSKPNSVSKYEVRKGHLPTKSDEIALADHYSGKYQIGQKISFTEKKNILGTTLLKRKSFKIVGFVRSSQILSNVNLGQSNSGTGELKGYAVVDPNAFNHTVYTTANLRYIDLRGLDSYGKVYTSKVKQHKKVLQEDLKGTANQRKERILSAASKKLVPQENKIHEAEQKLNAASHQINAAEKQLASQKEKLNSKVAQAKAAGINLPPSAQAQLERAKREIAAGEQKLQQEKRVFAQKSRDAAKKIKTGKEQINKAKRQLNKLALPSYSVYNRREVPGGEGNLVYTTVTQVVEDLAKVFPIFLYFVAALVTFTTMNRFIDEERINSGTMKALGYDDYVIINKFLAYGFISGTIGTILGVYLGHTLMPQIVYHAYYKSLTIPPIELHFHWQISLVALLLSWISSVLPAYLTAKNEFREKPAALLLPKAPAAGSTILLEKIPFIWNHLSFTHKVTARNIFRYKKRMLMTIFGVCGAATMLFAGFAVKNSITNMNNRQFNDLIHYNMIVAKKPGISVNQQKTLNNKLNENNIKSETPIYYESMSKIAGKTGDTQDITLIAPSSDKVLKYYVQLTNRKTKQTLHLTNNGVIISERLATLLKVSKGGYLTLTDKDNKSRRMKVAGITEMYMGHFVFMNKTQYQDIFKRNFKSNAYLVNLNNPSRKNTRNIAAQFMALSGVAGVVQNTAVSQELDVVVQSLNLIMLVLIVVAGLLAIVIQYNLTNINIAERIRELSTIKVLGFYDNEVTMYIYRETILLTGIGILVGYLTGDLLYRYILYVVPPDNVMFNPALSAPSFMWPLGVIGVITIILGFIVNKKLKDLDMLEALKSVD